MDHTAGCHLVFVDPDTGLQPPGNRGNTKPEHARIDELAPYVERGQSLVVYQHQRHRRTIDQQVRDKKAELEQGLGQTPFALVYKRHKSDRVFFFVVPAPGCYESLWARAGAMRKRGWDKYFELPM